MRGDRSVRLSGLVGALVSCFALGAGGSARGQTIPYFATQYPSAYVPLTGGTPLTFPFSEDDDAALIPIGFPFTFFGVSYTHVNVGTNGGLVFATSCSPGSLCQGWNFCGPSGMCEVTLPTSAPAFGTPMGMPSPDEPNAVIAPFWDDLHVQGGSVSYAVQGAAPARVLVVQWSNVRHFSGSQSRANFQVRLSEADYGVTFHYGPFVSGSDSGSFSGTIGIEDHTGTEGVTPFPCSNQGWQFCDASVLQGLTNQVIQFLGPTGAELVVSGQSATGGEPGTQVPIRIDVRNLGPQDTGVGFDVEVYFSTDQVIDATDTLLGTLNFPALAGRSVATATLTATVPQVPPGFYTVGAIVDPANVVPEDVETNNTALLTTTFLVGADLSIEVDAPPDSGPGELVDIPVRILNLGAAHAAVTYAVYLSRDQVLDANDTLLGEATVPVPANPVTPVVFGAVIPSMAPGRYYAIAVVDPHGDIAEANETNNTGVSVETTQLRGPDIVAASVSGRGAFAFRGESYELTVTLRNDGGATAADFLYSFHFSENTLINALADPLLGEFGPVTVGPGATQTLVHAVTVPTSLTPGPYYLGVIADSQTNLLEERTNNNIARTQGTITVRDPAPDFTAVRVRLPARAAAGESVTIERNLANEGNAGGLLVYDVYLSADRTLDPAQDVHLGRATLTLAARSEDIGVDTLRIPASVAAGSYYVAYHLDPDDDVSELFETNNTLVSDHTMAVLGSPLRILTTSLPLATLGVAYDVHLAATGGAQGLTWTLAAGALPPGLALETSGRLHGTPTEEGLSRITIAVTDGNLTVARDFSLLATEQTVALEVLTRALVPGFAGRRYEQPLIAFGGVPPHVWSLRGGDRLPMGLVMGEDGVIAGTPAMPAIANLNVRVTDAAGAFAEQSLILRVVNASSAVRFQSDVLPDARLGDPYQQEVRVAQGTGTSPFRFELASGELPPGLVFEPDPADNARALIHGVPTRVGTFAFGVRLTDSRGDFDLNRFVVHVEEGLGLTFVTTGLPAGEVGKPFTSELGEPVRVRAVGGAEAGEITYQRVSGELPPGLSLAEDGPITGTPTAPGLFTFVVLAGDERGQRDLRAFGVLVREAPEVPEPKIEEEGCSCSASGGSAPGAGVGLAFLALLFALRPGRWRLRAGLLGAMTLALPAVASAQLGTYRLDDYTAPYVERTGGTTLTFPGRDDSDVVITIPFAFRFFTTDHTQVRVSTNGYVTFGQRGTAYSNTTFPDQFDPNDMIALWWDDLEAGSVEYFVEGTAPTRVLIIQYRDAYRLGDPSTGMPQMQLWLHEGPAARFELRFGQLVGGSSGGFFGYTASVGFENANGTVGFNTLPCNPNCNDTDFASLGGRVFRAQQDAGEDVVALGVEVPAEVFQGVPFDARVSLASYHQNPIGPFVYALYLLAPGQTALTTPVFTSGPVTLQPYQTLTEVAPATIPLNTPVGRYRLALFVDALDEINEPDESNNVAISAGEFRIAARQPDFVVPEVVPGAASVAPGASLPVTVYLRNRGNLDGSAAWRLVLSRNEAISADDLVLHTGDVTLPLLTTATVTETVQIPSTVTPGSYYLGAILDPENLVPEISEVNNTGVAAQPVSVAVDAVNVATTALPRAYVGVDYSFHLAASGGNGTYEWGNTGTLPPGIVLVASTGELRGRPTAAGAYPLTLRVTSAGRSTTRELPFEVVPLEGGLTIVTRELLPGVVGAAYPPAPAGTAKEEQQHLVALGGAGAVRFSAVGPVPPGLTLDADGYLFGLPIQRGAFDLEVEATDDDTSVRRTLRLTIAEPGRLTLVADAVPDATVGREYVHQLRVLGRTSTVTFSSPGPLPPGLILTPEGALVGIPQRVGVWSFSVQAAEGSDAAAAQDTASYRVRVLADAGFGMTPTSLPIALVGKPYEATVEARQGRPPFAWRVLGPPLPRGLRFEIDRSQGAERLLFTGVPEVEALTSLLVTVIDGDGRSAQEGMSVLVQLPPPEGPVTPQPEQGCSCAATRSRGSPGSPGLAWLLVAGAALGLRRRGR